MKLEWIIILLIILNPLTSYPLENKEEDLAVLNVLVSGVDFTREQVRVLSEQIRESAIHNTNYRVMTEESVFAILKDKSVDLSKCTDVECAIDYGRRIQADKLVTTGIVFTEGDYYISIRLYDSPSASIERSINRTCEGCTFKALVQKVKELSDELFSEKGFKAKASEKSTGGIRLTTNEGGISIYIDGVKIGKTGEDGIFEGEIETGERIIRLEHPEYEPEEVKVSIRGGEVLERKIMLLKKTGRIIISSEPKGADVYLDNKKKGNTPITIDLPSGGYIVSVEREGYERDERRIEVRSGETKGYKFRLRLKVLPRKEEVGAEEKGKPTTSENGKTIGSYFYITGGYYYPFGDIGEHFGGGGVIELNTGLFSSDGFYISLGTRYIGDFKSNAPYLGNVFLELGYFLLKGSIFSLGAYSDLWTGYGGLSMETENGSLNINGMSLGMDLGLRMRLPYLTMKTGFSLFGFGGELVPAIIFGAGLDIW